MLLKMCVDFDDTLNDIRENGKISIFNEIWNTKDFQMEFWIREVFELMSTLFRFFYIFFNNIQVRSNNYFVGGNKSPCCQNK